MTRRYVYLIITGHDDHAILWHEQPIPEDGDMIVDLAPLVATIAAQAAAAGTTTTTTPPPPPLRQITVNRDTDGQIVSVEAVEEDDDA